MDSSGIVEGMTNPYDPAQPARTPHDRVPNPMAPPAAQPFGQPSWGGAPASTPAPSYGLPGRSRIHI
ncbi:hypothetical protein NWP09_08675 [Agrococcus sp. HG114]|nr:hypothetical protein [Agrococcus sp. HG114]MCR8671213.1 hypothetical protein [Agrococcus sp. HG114]